MTKIEKQFLILYRTRDIWYMGHIIWHTSLIKVISRADPRGVFPRSSSSKRRSAPNCCSCSNTGGRPFCLIWTGIFIVPVIWSTIILVVIVITSANVFRAKRSIATAVVGSSPVVIFRSVWRFVPVHAKKSLRTLAHFTLVQTIFKDRAQLFGLLLKNHCIGNVMRMPKIEPDKLI